MIASLLTIVATGNFVLYLIHRIGEKVAATHAHASVWTHRTHMRSTHSGAGEKHTQEKKEVSEKERTSFSSPKRERSHLFKSNKERGFVFKS
jgi:hypothetical protein